MLLSKKSKVGEEDSRLSPTTETPIVSCYFLLSNKVNNYLFQYLVDWHTFVTDRKVTCIQRHRPSLFLGILTPPIR